MWGIFCFSSPAKNDFSTQWVEGWEQNFSEDIVKDMFVNPPRIQLITTLT